MQIIYTFRVEITFVAWNAVWTGISVQLYSSSFPPFKVLKLPFTVNCTRPFIQFTMKQN
jgi:hypothetical protein